jgi:hypothetical protein
VLLSAWQLYALWRPLRLAEREPGRRRVLTWLTIIGVIVSASSAILLFRWPPPAVIVGHSIRYDSTAIASRALGVLTGFGYLVPTIGPLFASTLDVAPDRRDTGVVTEFDCADRA